MSVKYIDNMKNSRGVHARWAELIGSYSFYDLTRESDRGRLCVSRCPSHLPEPTQEELDMEKDWEPDPPPHLDLEKLAAQSAQLQTRPERICHMEEEQICMNLVFGLNKVQVGWERPHTLETVSSDWEDELGINISELHHDREEVSIDWEQDWDWTHSGETHPYSCQIQDEEIYYSDPEIYYSDPEIYYSDPEIYYSDPEIYYSDPEIYYSDPEIYYYDPDDMLAPPQTKNPMRTQCPSSSNGQEVRTNMETHTMSPGVPGTTLGTCRSPRRSTSRTSSARKATTGC